MAEADCGSSATANPLAFLQAMSNPRSGLRDVVKASFPQHLRAAGAFF